MRKRTCVTLVGAFSLAFGCGGEPRLTTASSQCSDPTPLSANWWRWVPIEDPSGNNVFQLPTAPGFVDDPRRWLEGTHVLRLWSTISPTHPDELEAQLSLRRSADLWPGPVSGIAVFTAPLPEYFPHPEPTKVAFDVSSNWTAPGELTVSVGGIDLTTGVSYPDGGMVLSFFTLGPNAASGRWTSGGQAQSVPRDTTFYFPQGYFCLARTD